MTHAHDNFSAHAARGVWAVVPVKLLAASKRRLSALLSHAERETLACAMLQDVLAALTRAPVLGGVLVITGDGRAARIARDAGAWVVDDAENRGTTAAVTTAAERLAHAGCTGIVVIPADVPSITPADVETIVQAHRGALSVTLAPAGIDGGTNALACSPPNAIPFCFGEDSFRRHVEAAKACGIEPQILYIENVSRDIDRPDDLGEFFKRPTRTHTYACLTACGLAQRLETVGS